MTAAAPVLGLQRLEDLQPGDRVGIEHMGRWFAREFIAREENPDGSPVLYFRCPGDAANSRLAYWPSDLIPRVTIRPTEELTFYATCPACMHFGHASDAYINCARCLGEHRIIIQPWEEAA